jgi:hypothetical protein
MTYSFLGATAGLPSSAILFRQGRKRGHSTFLPRVRGRLRGRSLNSRPMRRAVVLCQCSLPKKPVGKPANIKKRRMSAFLLVQDEVRVAVPVTQTSNKDESRADSAPQDLATRKLMLTGERAMKYFRIPVAYGFILGKSGAPPRR